MCIYIYISIYIYTHILHVYIGSLASLRPRKTNKSSPHKAILRPSSHHRQTLHRYCLDCPQCKECDSHKPADQFGAGSAGTRSKAERCLGCQYPSCTHCPGYRHPRSNRAVHIYHTRLEANAASGSVDDRKHVSRRQCRRERHDSAKAR